MKLGNCLSDEVLAHLEKKYKVRFSGSREVRVKAEKIGEKEQEIVTRELTKKWSK